MSDEKYVAFSIGKKPEDISKYAPYLFREALEALEREGCDYPVKITFTSTKVKKENKND